MKYKVGDKVRVRKDLEENKLYGEYETYKEQGKYKGMLAIIKRVNKASGYYDLDIDDGENYWTDEMLEPINENGQKEEKVRPKTDNLQKKILNLEMLLL